MKCKEIASAIEQLAPQTLAYDWDNVGLLCGDMEQEVKRVLLTLDLDFGVVEEAASVGAQMIVAHHPIMFDPVHRITEQTPDGKMLRALIRYDISYYAAHTNLDIANGGLNDLLAAKLGLQDVRILEYTQGCEIGIGRIGTLSQPITLAALANRLKNVLNAQALRYSGEPDGLVSRIAVNTGGGTSLIPAALDAGADVFITGDYKYAQIRHLAAHGMKVIDAGHYDTEFIVCELLHRHLQNQFGNELDLVVSQANTNVVKFI